MAKTKYVYFFGNGDADGDESMRAELGGKGANLAQMAKKPLSLPVPPGFTISTDVCQEFYKLGRKYPEGLDAEVEKYLARLEKTIGKKLGDEKDPLLVSVRSGAAISMPGMMDTILNLGLNDKSVLGLAAKTNNPRFAWDAYRRFIQMFGDVAMGVEHAKFEAIIDEVKSHRGIKQDTELNVEELQEIVSKYKVLYKNEKGEDFPQDPKVQMWGAIGAVFGSWMNPRAIKYRELNNIKEGALKGTAVTVMAMVFGNKGDTSGTGVCFSRDPSNGENVFMGEYLMNAQGEDVVAGIRTPQHLSQLEKTNPAIYAKCYVYVSYPEITLSLSDESIEMKIGDEYELTATIFPDNTGLTPTWFSSNKNVATVDNGIVHANGDGECDVIVNILDKTATCHVKVSGDDQISISLNLDKAILGANQLLTVYPSCSPDVPVELVVTSSDPSVAVARIKNRANASADRKSTRLNSSHT